MKKLLFLLMVIMTLMSCNQPTVTKTDLPIEIVSLKEAKKFDTTLTITTDSRVYIFSKQEEYQGSYGKQDAAIVFVILFLVTFILLVILIAIST